MNCARACLLGSQKRQVLTQQGIWSLGTLSLFFYISSSVTPIQILKLTRFIWKAFSHAEINAQKVFVWIMPPLSTVRHSLLQLGELGVNEISQVLKGGQRILTMAHFQSSHTLPKTDLTHLTIPSSNTADHKRSFMSSWVPDVSTHLQSSEGQLLNHGRNLHGKGRLSVSTHFMYSLTNFSGQAVRQNKLVN